jgi:hypothetical protein
VTQAVSLLVLLLAAIACGYFGKRVGSFTDATIFGVVGFAVLLVSVPWMPLDKDGQLNFLWTVPQILVGLLGAAIGGVAHRIIVKE